MFGALQLGLGLTPAKGGGVTDLSLLRKYAPTGAGAFLFNFARTDRTFQTVAGIALADDAGEAVGLALDSAAWGGKTLAGMLAVQPELFDEALAQSTATGTNKSYDAESGYYTVARNASGTGVISIAAVEAGKSYMVSLTRAPIGGEANHYSELRTDSTNALSELFTVEGPWSVVYRAIGTGTLVLFGGPNTGCSWGAKDISVKEIPGNHARQPTSTSYRGLRQSDGSILLDGADDHWLTPLLLGAAGTMAVDFNVSSTDGADGDILMGNYTSAGGKSGSCGINQLGQVFGGVGSLSGTTAKGTNNVLGLRTTLIFTYGGGQAALYENEVEVWSGSQGGTPTTEAIVLGAIGVNGTPNFAYCTAGKMYNAMVLPAAITASEAAALSRSWRNA